MKVVLPRYAMRSWWGWDGVLAEVLSVFTECAPELLLRYCVARLLQSVRGQVRVLLGHRVAGVLENMLH